jgi:hypothetical protein
MLFLKQVLAGRKHLLKRDEVHHSEISKYAEFRVKSVYNVFKDDARVMSFLPDLKTASKLPDRNWVLIVVNSLKPEIMK